MAVEKTFTGHRSTRRIPSILLAEGDSKVRSSVCSVLSPQYHVEEARDGAEAIELLENLRFDCVLLGIRPPGDDSLALLRRMKRASPELPVVVMCSAGDVSTAVEAIRAGAADFFIKDVETRNLGERIERVLGPSTNTSREGAGPVLRARMPGQMVVGRSARMREVMRTACRVAPYPVTVLVLGESGTGKELFARWIHRMSDRNAAPFVAVNLAAIPSDLIESTLFGHEKGAFTGAVGQRVGKFGQARDGTLLLDEITELKLELQPKLLRVLQEGEFEKVGGERIIQNQARIIAATNQDISSVVESGAFRADLYYRLNVVSITLPPLRERREDIPDLVNFFLAKYNRLYSRSIGSVAPDAMEDLVEHSWPGNIRELENMVQRAVITSDGECATADDLFNSEIPGQERIAEQIANRRGTLEDLERQYIEEILRRTSGHQGHAAKILGIDRKTLYNKIMKYGLGRSLNRKNGDASGSGKSPVQEEKRQGSRSRDSERSFA
jgi:two-component system response regulator HydG